MAILNAIWTFFATYILQKAPYMVGFLTLLGYCLMGKKWYDTLAVWRISRRSRNWRMI